MNSSINVHVECLPVKTFAFQIQEWKRGVFQRYFPDRDFTFVPMHVREKDFRREWAARILQADSPQIFVWGLKVPKGLRAFAEEHGIPVVVIEDGFIRSVEANASRTPPLSLALDAGTA